MNKDEEKSKAAIRMKEWRKNNPDKAKEANRKMYLKHKNTFKACSDRFRKKNPDYAKKYWIENKERIISLCKAWFLSHKVEMAEYRKAYYKTYYAKNKEALLLYQKEWKKKKKATP